MVQPGDTVAMLPRLEKGEAQPTPQARTPSDEQPGFQPGFSDEQPGFQPGFWQSAGAMPSAELLTTTREQLSEILGGSGRASMVWDCLRAGEDPMCASSVTEKTKGMLALAGLGVTRAGSLSEQTVTRDGTVKLLVRLSDGLEVETVLIPWTERGRTTICVSSQVGCAQACTFW
ncbi:hypothetical protein T492DRAFT_256868 [Pavlovales sp. CCMP2436]|nr:hypothetical protein T492DRAFT_256868 [Pavlovales sp. CCMP2436]